MRDIIGLTLMGFFLIMAIRALWNEVVMGMGLPYESKDDRYQ